MKNLKITRKITQGVYVLTTKNGGCVVDAVSQISSGDNPLIAVAVMKSNYTNQLLKENSYMALSVLGKEVDPNIIKTFGLSSMRDLDKFEQVETIKEKNIPIIKSSLGYMVCEIVDRIENETHTLFIGKIIEADMTKDEEPLTYQYYQEHKEQLLKVTTEKGKTAFVCLVCGYVCYQDELEDDFKCPVCGVGKDMFQKQLQ